MASNTKYYGTFANGTFCGQPRSIQKSDNTSLEVEIVGRYTDIENLVIQSEPGDVLPVASAQGDSFLGFKIKTLQCQREAGDVGILRASLVRASGSSQPYHITYSIDMQEVQKNLICHPLFKKHPESVKYIDLWNNTAPGKRVDWDATSDTEKFKYYDTETLDGTLQNITDEYAIKYCKAIIAGIETFNTYLPVISKVSLYLKEPPGLSQNATTHALSGSLDYSGNIGTWDSSFGFTIKNYNDSAIGGWFKSTDKWSQLADGTWQREEGWVYTNDKSHSWIYEEAI